MHHQAFENYRIEDRHECTLLSARVNALLWSQSLFLAAWAVMQNNSDLGRMKPMMELIAKLAIFICALSFIAILMSCRILRKWHERGQKLIDEDEHNKQLPDFHLDRHAPDWPHVLSIDLFSLAIPLAFITLWIGALIHSAQIDDQSDREAQGLKTSFNIASEPVSLFFVRERGAPADFADRADGDGKE